jgi:hypothetical protein
MITNTRRVGVSRRSVGRTGRADAFGAKPKRLCCLSTFSACDFGLPQAALYEQAVSDLTRRLEDSEGIARRGLVNPNMKLVLALGLLGRSSKLSRVDMVRALAV